MERSKLGTMTKNEPFNNRKRKIEPPCLHAVKLRSHKKENKRKSHEICLERFKAIDDFCMSINV